MLGSNSHSSSAHAATRARSEVEATRSLIADLSWNNLSWQQAKTVLLGAQKAPDSRFFELPQVLVAKILKMAHRPQWQPRFTGLRAVPRRMGLISARGTRLSFRANPSLVESDDPRSTPSVELDGEGVQACVLRLSEVGIGSVAIDWTCAVPTSGGVPVFGAPMTYQWDDMDAPEPYGELLAEYPWAEAPCFPLPGGEGVRTVTVRSGTVEADIEVDLAAEREAAVHFGAPGVQLGERAGG